MTEKLRFSVAVSVYRQFNFVLFAHERIVLDRHFNLLFAFFLFRYQEVRPHVERFDVSASICKSVTHHGDFLYHRRLRGLAFSDQGAACDLG